MSLTPKNLSFNCSYSKQRLWIRLCQLQKAGANGGTVVHARGLSKEAVKYLGITIQPEKELVLILTTKDKMALWKVSSMK